ncbi:hypothetical protein V5O48_001244 [Marasmius crinis-equi]|uniref:WH2 domain-containing protein n=1 Tax=Marasmius crinis-equi TaxID=585013 RepID=A0ABR3FZ21_9AGAR
MTTAPSTNSRASLLSGLRTGGVRSVSNTIPHTAAPGATFNIPRAVSHSFPEEEEDQVLEIPSRNLYANNHHGASHIMPMTAAVDGPNNRFTQQQQRGMNPNSVPFSPAFNPGMNQNVQQQAFQMQMMQLELLKLQAAQQYQAELMAQAQRQQQQQNRRTSFNPPATAGPLATGFDLHSATVSAQMRRASEQQQQSYQSQLGVSEDHVPMTAAIGGRFGSRTNFPNRFEDNSDIPSSYGSTTVISGGTSLGNPNSNNSASTSVPSKSDAATSWRRGGKGNSVLNGANRAVTSPSVKVTPPEPERSSPPLVTSPVAKNRPQPLRFSPVVQQPLPTVTIDSSDGNDNDDTSSNSSSKSGATNSSPTTPQSSSSNEMPLSPREEASKKLYEGLGMGRPGSALAQQPYGSPPSDSNVVLVSHRLVSQPKRQPRGPPSGADELGPKNFATRIRRKAIGGLGMLMDARERREVEAF